MKLLNFAQQQLCYGAANIGMNAARIKELARAGVTGFNAQFVAADGDTFELNNVDAPYLIRRGNELIAANYNLTRLALVGDDFNTPMCKGYRTPSTFYGPVGFGIMSCYHTMVVNNPVDSFDFDEL